MSKNIKNIIYLLILFSIIWCGIGGYMDVTDKERVELLGMKATKFHFWYDAMFALVLCIVILLLQKM
jgi:hypothetical protein